MWEITLHVVWIYRLYGMINIAVRAFFSVDTGVTLTTRTAPTTMVHITRISFHWTVSPSKRCA